MSTGALLTIMCDLQHYLVEETKNVDTSDIFRVQDELIDSGLDMHEAEKMFMHTSKVKEFLSAMSTDIEIFKKVDKFREDRMKETKLIEKKKKELEEAQALVATKLAELAELQKVSGP